MTAADAKREQAIQDLISAGFGVKDEVTDEIRVAWSRFIDAHCQKDRANG